MAVEAISPSSSPVIKSPLDRREYQVVRLPNGLCALLIHDPRMLSSSSDGEENGEEDGDDDEEEEDDDDGSDGCDSSQEEDCSEEEDDSIASEEDEDHPSGGQGHKKTRAAAAMSVGIGSFSDPQDGQGIAHFLEHMLFMGSSKFPDENEYDGFLSKHGGFSNAFTETEWTCYYFAINHKYLKPALERFSQFFVSPLIKAEAMEREIQAVDSEFEGHLQSDGARLSQLQCNTADRLHPFNRFTWGNRKSLNEATSKGINLREKLLEMYRENYLAGSMKLAVLGAEPLGTLKEWVLDLFNEVAAGGQGRVIFPWEGPVWEPGKMYRMKSVKDQHFLSLIWPFPCLEKAYLKKPQHYISHLIGHEGAGSLLSLLKQKRWATHLSAGVGEGGFERCSSGYMFNVRIFLTDSGVEEVYEVVSLVYQYVGMLKNVGPQEWVFKELQAIAEMEFRFVEEEHEDDYVVSLATNMHLYPDEHIIYGEHANEIWDPTLVQSLLDQLTPQNMRIDLVTKSFNMCASGVQYEPWFCVPFTVEDISSSLMDLWSDPRRCIDPMLHMPVINEYIPRDFSLRAPNKNSIDFPRILFEDSSMKVWYKLDQKFQMPRANTYFLITCYGAYESVKAAVLMELYVRLLKDALNETVYLANVAGLDSSISITGDRIEIKLHGFNDKLPILATNMTRVYKDFRPSAERFLAIKEELERDYKNINMKPGKHATYLRLQVLRKVFWDVNDKLLALPDLSLDSLKSFIPQIFSKTYIEALCHGNLSEVEAMEITKILKDSLIKIPLGKSWGFKQSILRLPTHSSLLYSANAKNPSEENSVVEMYFQLEQDIGTETIRSRAINDLFESIIYEPYFNELRTKEQLGYTVDCSVRSTNRVLGFCFVVQSAKYSPEYLKHRMEIFIEKIPELLVAISQEEFANYIAALVANKLEEHHSLLDETNRYWSEIAERRYIFCTEKAEAEELKKLVKHDLIEWYNTFLCGKSSNRRQLTIFVRGSGAHAQNSGECIGAPAKGVIDSVKSIEDISLLKQESEFYPSLY